MLKNIVDINSMIDKIHDELESFNNEERKEIKKNNKTIELYLLELEKVREVLYNQLKDRYDILVPNDKILKNQNIDINVCFEKVNYLSTNKYIYKMGIDKNLYEIRYSNSLDIINDNIKSLINKFLLINVNLSKEDFKFSLPLYKYMNDFYDYKDTDDFGIKIKNTFDLLYWECPNLVMHIYLGFMLLLEKYKDKFEIYIRNKYDGDYVLELDKYYQIIIDKDMEEVTDEYIIYNKFVDGELRVDDYITNSNSRKDIISKFINYDKYNSFNALEKNDFYEQIKSVYEDLCEYLWINKYNYMITKVKEIYNAKSSYTSNYSGLIKELKGLNRQRISLNNKLYFHYKKMNDKNNDKLLKKYNNLYNKANSKIDEIIDKYSNYDEMLFINDVISKLNDDSTYYDVFKLFEDNYCYFLNFSKEHEGDYADYNKFIYSPYLNISKNIPFISDVNIENKLLEKYDLFDIDVDFNDKNKLKEDLEYIIRLGYYEKNNINIDKFKLIFDIKKIINEKSI